MHYFILLFLVFSGLLTPSYASPEFPVKPDYMLTPGSLCQSPDSYRYPEKIPYCERESLERGLKDLVFEEYRRRGYVLPVSDRYDYKVDHLIPLCAGGSNLEDNLWPQHKSLYVRTDSLERIGCEKLRAGKIRQRDLVEMIISAKRDLSLVPRIMSLLSSL